MSNPGRVSTSKLGNATPLAIRSTTYCVPCGGQAALLSRLPLGALVTPLAKQNPGDVREFDLSTVENEMLVLF